MTETRYHTGIFVLQAGQRVRVRVTSLSQFGHFIGDNFSQKERQKTPGNRFYFPDLTDFVT